MTAIKPGDLISIECTTGLNSSGRFYFFKDFKYGEKVPIYSGALVLVTRVERGIKQSKLGVNRTQDTIYFLHENQIYCTSDVNLKNTTFNWGRKIG